MQLKRNKPNIQYSIIKRESYPYKASEMLLCFWDACQKGNMRLCNDGFTSFWFDIWNETRSGGQKAQAPPSPLNNYTHTNKQTNKQTRKGQKFLFLEKCSSHCQQIMLFQTFPETIMFSRSFVRDKFDHSLLAIGLKRENRVSLCVGPLWPWWLLQIHSRQCKINCRDKLRRDENSLKTLSQLTRSPVELEIIWFPSGCLSAERITSTVLLYWFV